jgi:hypothetical protein
MTKIGERTASPILPQITRPSSLRAVKYANNALQAAEGQLHRALGASLIARLESKYISTSSKSHLRLRLDDPHRPSCQENLAMTPLLLIQKQTASDLSDSISWRQSQLLLPVSYEAFLRIKDQHTLPCRTPGQRKSIQRKSASTVSLLPFGRIYGTS